MFCLAENTTDFRRMQVKADGSCWVYATLAGLGKLEHATPLPWGKKQTCMDPTEQDQMMDLDARQWIFENTHGDKMFDDILKVPDYERNRSIDKFLGSFGTQFHYQQLCEKFDINIILWDEVDEDDIIFITKNAVEYADKEWALAAAHSASVVNIAMSKDKDRHVNVYLKND